MSDDAAIRERLKAAEILIVEISRRLDEKFDLHKNAHDREHALLEAAREATRHAMDYRLETMNALRQQTDRVEHESVKRGEWAKAHTDLVDSLNVKYEAILSQMAAHARGNEERFRAIEHYVWMGIGAAGLIGVLLHWVKV